MRAGHHDRGARGQGSHGGGGRGEKEDASGVLSSGQALSCRSEARGSGRGEDEEQTWPPARREKGEEGAGGRRERRAWEVALKMAVRSLRHARP